MIEAEGIKHTVADLVAQLEMGLFEQNDFWEFYNAARQSIEAHTQLVYPQDRVTYLTDVLIGSVMGSAQYEYSDLLKNGEVNHYIKVDLDE